MLKRGWRESPLDLVSRRVTLTEFRKVTMDDLTFSWACSGKASVTASMR